MHLIFPRLLEIKVTESTVLKNVKFEHSFAFIRKEGYLSQAMASNETVSSTISPRLFSAVAVYLTLVTTGSILFNGLASYVIFAKLRVSNQQMKILLSMLIADTLTPALSHPLVIYANFKMHWDLGSHACSYYAFVTSTGGLTTIYHLVLLSWERFCGLVHPYDYDRLISPRNINIALVLAWVLPTVTSTFPLFGWSSYVLEGIGTSCSFDLSPMSWSGKSFNVFLIIFYFALPMMFIVYFNTSFLSVVFELVRCPCDVRKRFINQLSQHNPFCQASFDRKLAKQMSVLVTLLIICFLLSWLPYAVVAIIGIFDKLPHGNPTAISLPSFFAKMYTIYDSVVYFFLDKRSRKAFRLLFCKSQAVSSMG